MSSTSFAVGIALGKVQRNQLHSADGGNSFLQNVGYAYNIHGSIKSVNQVNFDPDQTQEIDYFAMEMAYETDAFASGSEPRKDGVISSVKWLIQTLETNIKPLKATH